METVVVKYASRVVTLSLTAMLFAGGIFSATARTTVEDLSVAPVADTPADESGCPKPILKKTYRHYTVHYHINKWDIDSEFHENAAVMERMKSELDSLDLIKWGGYRLDTLLITSSASFDGSLAFNQLLSRERGNTILSRIRKWYPDEDTYQTEITEVPEDWFTLRKVVEEDADFPGRIEVLEIIDNPDLTPEQKEYRLRSLKHSFRYLINNYVDEMRTASATVVLVYEFVPVAPLAPVRSLAEAPAIYPSFARKAEPETPVAVPADTAAERPKLTFAALKTNMLYDAVTAVNFAVEFAINENFSFQYEHVCPWWLSKDNRRCLQILSFGGEFRWWFAPRPQSVTEKLLRRDALQGHFLGVYGFGGKTDIQWDRKIGNYQAEFFSAGLTYGYSMPIARWLNLEFSISAGYARIPYRHYIPTDDWQILVRDLQKVGVLHWFGPTKAQITLSIPLQAKYNPARPCAQRRDLRIDGKEKAWKEAEAARKERRTGK